MKRILMSLLPHVVTMSCGIDPEAFKPQSEEVMTCENVQEKQDSNEELSSSETIKLEDCQREQEVASETPQPEQQVNEESPQEEPSITNTEISVEVDVKVSVESDTPLEDEVETPDKLRRGLTKEQVLHILGEPDKTILTAAAHMWQYQGASICEEGRDFCTVYFYQNELNMTHGIKQEHKDFMSL